MNDETCRLRARDNGTRAESLSKIARAATRAAQAIDQLAASTPPPTGTEEGLSEWKRLAASLGGALQVGHLRIEVSANNTVVVQQEFDKKGQPDAVLLQVIPSGELEVEALSVEGGDTSEIDARYKGELRQLLVAAARSDELSIDPDALTIRIERDSFSADETATRLAHLNRIVALLRGEVGPYR